MRSGDKGQQHMLGGKKGCLFPSIPALPDAILDSTHMLDSRGQPSLPQNASRCQAKTASALPPQDGQQQGELSEDTISPELDQCSA